MRLASAARVVAWLAGGLLILGGVALLLDREGAVADRWLGVSLAGLGLFVGFVLWMLADLWEAQRLREIAEEANRARLREASGSVWPADPAARPRS